MIGAISDLGTILMTNENTSQQTESKRRMNSVRARNNGGDHLIDGDENMDHTRVIFVGGWSPGPLTNLKQVVVMRSHEMINPSGLNLYMPPFPGLWCLHPVFIFAVLGFPASIHWVCSSMAPLYYVPLVILLVLGWGKLFLDFVVPLIVRSAIDSSIGRIHREGIDCGKVLIIGFSWGGCIVAEMIARGMVGQANQPSAILIAPTTALLARVAHQDDAASRIARMELENVQSRITVVHGSFDTSFCPHQNRWDNISGVELVTLRDDHIFMTPSSLETLEHILLRYLQH